MRVCVADLGAEEHRKMATQRGGMGGNGLLIFVQMRHRRRNFDTLLLYYSDCCKTLCTRRAMSPPLLDQDLVPALPVLCLYVVWQITISAAVRSTGL